MRTTSTLAALRAAQDAGIVAESAADRLAEAWRLASRLRSANTLLSGQTSDVLPTDRKKLDGIGRLLGYPPRSATAGRGGLSRHDPAGASRLRAALLRLTTGTKRAPVTRGPFFVRERQTP